LAIVGAGSASNYSGSIFIAVFIDIEYTDFGLKAEGRMLKKKNHK